MNNKEELDFEVYDVNEIHAPEFSKKVHAVFDRLDQLLNEDKDNDQ